MLEEILSLSKILIAISTVTGDEKALDLAIEIAYQDLYDYNVRRYKTNGISSLLYYNTDKFPEKFRILLSANLDVVSAQESQFKPLIKDNKLYGRGAYDVKAAVAAVILAFKEVAKKVDYPLGLQIVADGELDSQSVKHQIEQGLRADFIISLIPTDFGISNMSKGMLWLKITSSGKAAHGGFPWHGDNAILKMKPLLDSLEKEFPSPNEDSWVTTVNVARISTTNEEYNNIPDNCEMLLDVRYIPEDEATILERIKKLVPEGFTVEVILNDFSESTPEENEEFTLLAKAVEKVTGKKANIMKKHFADSVRYFKPVGGQGASFGPLGGGAHAAEEWVDIQSLADFYKAIKEFLLSVK